jgi:hypothetical protein
MIFPSSLSSAPCAYTHEHIGLFRKNMSFNVSSPYPILKIKAVCQGELKSCSALSYHFPQLTKSSFAKTNSIAEEKEEVNVHWQTMAEHSGLYDPPFFPKIIKYTFLAVGSSTNS